MMEESPEIERIRKRLSNLTNDSIANWLRDDLLNYGSDEEITKKLASMATSYADCQNVEVLISFFKDNNSEIRYLAINYAHNSLPQASDILFGCLADSLNDSSPSVQNAVLSALGSISPEYSEPGLRAVQELFKFPFYSDEVMKKAADTISSLKLKAKRTNRDKTLNRQLDELHHKFSLEDPKILCQTLRALRHLGQKKSIKPILGLQQKKIWEKNPELREEFAKTLGELGGKDAALAVADLFIDSDANVRSAASNALYSMNISDSKAGYQKLWLSEKSSQEIALLACAKLSVLCEAEDRLAFYSGVQGYDYTTTSILEELRSFRLLNSESPATHFSFPFVPTSSSTAFQNTLERILKLQNRPDPRIIPVMVETFEAYKDFSEDVPRACCKVLSSFGRHGFGPLRRLLEKMKVEDEEENLLIPDLNNTLVGVLVRAIGATKTEEAADPLLKYLKCKIPHLLNDAALSMLDVGPKAIPTLLQELKLVNSCNSETSSRSIGTAAWLLGDMHVKEASSFVLAGLESKWPDIRLGCAKAAKELKIPEAFPLLLKLVNDERAETCKIAIQAIGEFGGGEGAFDAILPKTKDIDPEIKFLAFNVLVKLSDPRSSEIIKNYLTVLLDASPSNASTKSASQKEDYDRGQKCAELISLLGNMADQVAKDYLYHLITTPLSFPSKPYSQGQWQVDDLALQWLAKFDPAGIVHWLNEGRRTCTITLSDYNYKLEKVGPYLSQESGSVGSKGGRPEDVASILQRMPIQGTVVPQDTRHVGQVLKA